MNSAPIIKLKNISFRYPSSASPVCNKLNFWLYPDERVALVGGNGSGKTTLLHLLVGLLQPDEGVVQVFGRECRREKDFRYVRRRVGLLFQNPDDQLFCSTVAEDIAFGPLNLGCTQEEANRRVTETLERLGLSGYAYRATSTLSGGEKRLVSLGTILSMQPDILLLDEPTAGLDETTREHLMQIIESATPTAVIISHDRELLASLTHRTVMLTRGSLFETKLDRADLPRAPALP